VEPAESGWSFYSLAIIFDPYCSGLFKTSLYMSFYVEWFRHAIVEELAGLGARIYVCDISETLLNQSLSEWEKKGFQVSGSICDVSSHSERETLMQTVSKMFDGKLNILVS